MYKVSKSLKELKEQQQESDRSFFITLAIVALVIAIFLVLRTFVFFTVIVDGSSMNPTLQSGDVLVANKLCGFKRGDIVVIDSQQKASNGEQKLLIKRIIAVGKDSVEIIDGVVKVNGKVIIEDYIFEDYSDVDDDYDYFVVPEGEVFYLGDNRANSSDSRLTGTCKNGQVLGVVEQWSLSTRGISGFFYKVSNFFRGGI